MLHLRVQRIADPQNKNAPAGLCLQVRRTLQDRQNFSEISERFTAISGRHPLHPSRIHTLGSQLALNWLSMGSQLALNSPRRIASTLLMEIQMRKIPFILSIVL